MHPRKLLTAALLILPPLAQAQVDSRVPDSLLSEAAVVFDDSYTVPQSVSRVSALNAEVNAGFRTLAEQIADDAGCHP